MSRTALPRSAASMFALMLSLPVAAQHVHAVEEEEPAPVDHSQHTGHAMPETTPVDPHAGHVGHAGDPSTPVPPLTEADRAAAFPTISEHMQHADGINTFLRFDRLEAWHDDGEDGQAWEIGGWAGTDTDRLWLRSEGEREAGQTHAADLELLYGHSVGPWWDVVGGVRHDFQPDGSQTWAAVGVQGLAPWFIELQATAYLSDEGQVAAEFEAEHHARLSTRWILESQLELALHGDDDPARGIGSGLSSVEAGLRLRYEITPRFAPYVGLAWERRYGDTADLAEAAGESVEGTRVVAGLRFWF